MEVFKNVECLLLFKSLIIAFFRPQSFFSHYTTGLGASPMAAMHREGGLASVPPLHKGTH